MRISQDKKVCPIGHTLSAAAITLGWYLLAAHPHGNVFNQPLSQQEVLGYFDTAAECQKAADADHANMKEQARQLDEGNLDLDSETADQMRLSSVGVGAAQCVSTDDPRLQQ